MMYEMVNKMMNELNEMWNEVVNEMSELRAVMSVM